MKSMVEHECGGEPTGIGAGTRPIVSKVMELYTAMCYHKSVILTGGPQTGKSTSCIRFKVKMKTCRIRRTKNSFF